MASSPAIRLVFCAVLLACAAHVHGAEPVEPERITALNQYLASVKEQRWADALQPAERLLEIAKVEGPRSPQMTDALTRVGGVQFALGEYDNASSNFIAAITLAEKEEGPLDESLEEPLRGLGYTLAATDRHTEAVQVLERALLLSQRHNGLFDLSQRGLRQQLGNSLSEIGRGVEAEQQFRYILQTAEQAFGVDDIRLAETLDFVGDWYARWGHFESGRHLYRRAIELIETKATPVDARLINPLRSLSRSYTRELLFSNAGQVLVGPDGQISRPLRRTRLPEEGEEALVRAINVMETTERRNPLAFRSALIDAGDWFFLKDQEERALEYYRRALEEPAVDATSAATAGDPLSYPTQLDFAYPPVARRFLDRPEDRVIERKLVVDFTVTAEGAVEDLRVVESDATERMERETVLAMREALYRPRFENGEPVATQNVRYTQTFRELKN